MPFRKLNREEKKNLFLFLADPFYPLFGKWYYLASEVYLGIIGGVMFSTIVFYSGWVIRKFYEIIILNNMAKEKSKSN